MNRKFVVPATLAIVILLSLASLAAAQGSDRVVKATGHLSVDQVRPGDKFKISVELQVAEGYHINAHNPTLDYLVATNVLFQAPAGIRIGEARYPAPVQRSFEFSPDTKLAVHEGTVTIEADAEADKSLSPDAGPIRAKVVVQSCNQSQCLAPAELDLDLPLRKGSAAGSAFSGPGTGDGAQSFSPGVALKPSRFDIRGVPTILFLDKSGKEVSDLRLEGFEKPDGFLSRMKQVESGVAGSEGPKTDTISAWIARYGIGVALIFVFLSGLALNTTPCVYPIIPITIGFFANQGSAGQKPRLWSTFRMAAAYVLGMAITYSVLGVIASLSGGLFGALLQKPAVLIGLAVLMIALSLSMFGVYEFRMPESLNRFATSSTQSTTGLVGALMMGLTMGIVAAPCIGPFVVALLVHVGAKGSPAYGFLLFFVLALGLGFPYLFLGTFSGALKALPRSGMWMVTVRKVFGLILIGMAIYFLMPLLGKWSNPVLVAYFVLSAAYLILWEAGRTKPMQFAWLLRAIGAGAAVAAVLLILPKKTEAEIAWQPYSEASLAAAQREGKGVIIDVYADWCIPCKELDKATFTDPEVRKEAESFVTLKLNLTQGAPDAAGVNARAETAAAGVSAKAETAASGPASSTDAASTVAASAPDQGTPMPGATVKTLDGGMLDLQSMRGKVVVIDFWATWCVPCMSEIPTFAALNKQYKASGLEVLALATDPEGEAKVKPFVKAHPMAYSVGLADAATALAFGVGDSLPVTILVDKQGRIRFTHNGITEKSAFETEIRQLLAE
jgi:thiol:disulfide interchange protein DsbD